MINSSIVELGTKAPLLGLEGKDLDDTPEMTKLTDEISNLSSVTNHKDANWTLVEQCSRVILRDYVKHFQVACYYGQSLIKTGLGLQGIAAGACVFDGICKNFWQDALPSAKRKKGRFNSINFWVEQVSQYLESYDGGDIPQETVDEAVEMMTALDSTLYEIDEENAPNLRYIINLIKGLPVKYSEPEAVQPDNAESGAVMQDTAQNQGSSVSKTEPQIQQLPPAVQAQQNPVPVAPATSSSSSNIPVKVDIPDNASNEQKLKVASRLIGEVADDIFKNDVFDPLCYRLRRRAAWISIKSIPYNENNVTRIPSPNQEIKNSIEKLFLSNQFELVLKMVEPRVTVYLYWLDLSYYSWKSLVELKKEAAANEVAVAVSSLSKRIKGVENLCFDDGTPMSSNETKAWILGLSENCDTNRQNIDVIKSNISNVINESMSKFEDALQILENYIKSSHGIDKLRYETVLAYIFAKNKRTELALGIVQEILKTLADNRLAEWNTDIATEIYSYSFDVFKLCEKIDSAQMVLTKLAKISPTIAVTKSYVDE
ncbi:MAG: type VI secretion system domain-containing protein [Succinivibrionaceae bacterium]|jgi:type VI secretion system protein VasJ|nr:type VI secretion system domain-containing protein [Succinivibrionaceae bacterium]